MGILQDKLLEERLLQIEGDHCIITLPVEEREAVWSSVVQRPKCSYEFCTQRLKVGFYHYSALVLHAEQDMLIPFVAAYIVNVDTQAKQIQADWQEDY